MKIDGAPLLHPQAPTLHLTVPLLNLFNSIFSTENLFNINENYSCDFKHVFKFSPDSIYQFYFIVLKVVFFYVTLFLAGDLNILVQVRLRSKEKCLLVVK